MVALFFIDLARCKLSRMNKMTLVLLPGMDGTGALFEPFIAALGNEFNVRVVTYPITGALGYAELEAIALASLPEGEPFVILGESFSGPIAVSLASAAGENLKALILCCTFVRNPRPVASILRGLVGILPVAVAPVNFLSHLLLGRFSTSALRETLAKSLRHVSPSALRARLKAVIDVDVSKKLATVSVPILYMRASQDRLVPASASALVSSLRPNTQVVELNAPHFLLQAVPEEAVKVVCVFVRRAMG
jgi:pimeloyl-ACP methyl ester carboxylesterase